MGRKGGWLATAVFLEINGVSVAKAADDDVYDLVMGVASLASNIEEIADRLEQLHESRH